MYDYHSHSFFSDDSITPLKEHIQGAINIGVKEIAITDHYDPDYPDKNFPFDLKFKEYHEALLEAEEYFKGQIKIIKGIEIGIQHGATNKKCLAASVAFDYDFILGSFHSAKGEDLYDGYFNSRKEKDGVLEFYNYVYDGIKDFNNFDVLGHINVIDRYVKNVPEYKDYMNIIECILKELIEMGKGIEINTSSQRYGLSPLSTPNKEILTMYKNLGGEFITIGSDAHKISQIGYMYKEATELLLSHGFKYITTYENRIPTQIKI